jgi:hypothetical protein
MSRKKQYQTRLDPDVADRVEQYADENDLSNSEAVRRLVRTGIETVGGPTRDEIAADLDEIRSEIRGVRDEVEDTDDGGGLFRARQSGTILVLLLSAVLGLLVGILAPGIMPI